MRIAFEQPVSWWALLLLIGAVCAVGYLSYRRLPVALDNRRRWLLTILRTSSLLLLLGILFQPVIIIPSPRQNRPPLPILLDVSRSMRIVEGGVRRFDRALSIVSKTLVPELSRDFRPDVFTFGDRLVNAQGELTPDATRSDLSGALDRVRQRFEGQSVAGVIVLTDGAATGPVEQPRGDRTIPIFPIGIGETDALRDREVVDAVAVEATLAESVIDLAVSAVSRGFETEPLEIRLFENGRLLDIRRSVPLSAGSPVREIFAVSPNPDKPTLYTVQVPADSSEAVTENNVRSVLVRPQGRKRRLLMIEGAPGHEHSFLKRAWAADPGLEFDSVARKGKNEQREDTFVVQASSSRAAALSAGLPASRQALFAYDSVIIANVEASFFSRDQQELIADFVAERGGGLLILGARSFIGDRLRETPLEAALPLELNDRVGAAAASNETMHRIQAGKLLLTEEGAMHPMMRFSLSAEENRRRWNVVPPVASSVGLGAPRPGASLLAVTGGPAGSVRPLIAVQRYGRGRSMVFAGEASWRWRMMLPATDRTYEIFWRQVARWLSTTAPDPISVTVEGHDAPALEPLKIITTVLDAEFRPRADAFVTVKMRRPDGSEVAATARLADRASGRYEAVVHAGQGGVHHLAAEARQGSQLLGVARDTFLVGASDPEFADPRMNAALLRRLADWTGGAFSAADDASNVPALLRRQTSGEVLLEQRPLWHHPLVFATLVVFLSFEWLLRRQAGLL